MTVSLIRCVLLAGEKVNLRPVSPEDAASAFTLLHGRQAILRWLVWDGPETREDLSPFFSSWTEDGDDARDYRLAIVDRETNELAGVISLRFIGHPRTGDVGYWLGERFWGRGYMTEAVRLAAHLAFAHLSAQALCAYVFEGNTASRVVLERTGFGFVRTVRGRTRKGGLPVDEGYFTLLRSEWLRVRASWPSIQEEIARENE